MVDLPINSMVDLSSSLCKRLPEGTKHLIVGYTSSISHDIPITVEILSCQLEPQNVRHTGPRPLLLGHLGILGPFLKKSSK